MPIAPAFEPTLVEANANRVVYFQWKRNGLFALLQLSRCFLFGVRVSSLRHCHDQVCRSFLFRDCEFLEWACEYRDSILGRSYLGPGEHRQLTWGKN